MWRRLKKSGHGARGARVPWGSPPVVGGCAKVRVCDVGVDQVVAGWSYSPVISVSYPSMSAP